MLISGTCNRLMVASSRRISSVSPLADSASTTSPRTTIPRSPCTASTGCINNAGVPIELRVAATLRAIIPLLPMPVTTTRPRQASIKSTARSKACAIGPAMRSANARSASASIRTTFSPVCFMGRRMLPKTQGREPYQCDRERRENLKTRRARSMPQRAQRKAETVFLNSQKAARTHSAPSTL